MEERQIPVVTVSLPTYTITEPPDIEAIGPVIDEVVCANFGQADERILALRGVSLIDHPGHTHDSLAEVILATGVDRYDPERVGPTDAGYAAYGVELHVGHCAVSATSLRTLWAKSPTFHGTISPSVFAKWASDFYQGPPVDRGGVPLRIDLITIYDPAHLEGIQIPFHGDEKPPYSACRFKYPDRRRDALLGLVKIL
ncbi:hypothetical protein [Tenggerimyces flavus]|uniref:Uncharacterized protein n=1 Tax=Tenggerimyces flavus TaxID=1708749 RepID=A0ABV7YN93_9ACTN|nr:hypothetical protein [Tenggerimyces flavus]MBM7784759.1 hypothetical protein [Tenggerimyces flavus]